MARQQRIDFPGAIHHVMNRGARKQEIFLDEGARRFFMEVVARMCRDFGLTLVAFALMPNHYHLLLVSRRGQLSSSMQFLGREYTQAVNARQGWDGALFRGRFRNRLVLDHDYLRHLVAYIHANPARAGMGIRPDWTSRAGMLGAAVPDFMDMDIAHRMFADTREYLAYEAGVVGRDQPVPECFEEERLWRGPWTDVIGSSIDVARPSPEQAIEEVLRLTGISWKAIDGPIGRPRRAVRQEEIWLLSWWLCTGAGLSQAATAEILDISQQRVSQHLKAARLRAQNDAQLDAWMSELSAWFEDVGPTGLYF